jgi:hypothetical protein
LVKKNKNRLVFGKCVSPYRRIRTIVIGFEIIISSMTSMSNSDSVPYIAKLLEKIALMQSQLDDLSKQKQENETTPPVLLDKQVAIDVDTNNVQEEDDEEEDEEVEVDVTDNITGKLYVDMPFLASG